MRLSARSARITSYNVCYTKLVRIPGGAVITCDRRISCGESIEELLKEIEPMISDVKGASARIDTEHVTTYTGYQMECVDYFPSWVLEEQHPLIQAGVAAYKGMFEREPVRNNFV